MFEWIKRLFETDEGDTMYLLGVRWIYIAKKWVEVEELSEIYKKYKSK